jgi:hypothetical protein
MTSAQRTGPAAVRGLLTDATEAYADHPQAVAVLKQHLDRVDEPLRVAIAGKMKAGKSTLLNALVGEEIAPTDAGECTKVVTWYEYAATPRVSMIVDGGRTRPLPVRRVGGKLSISLAGRTYEEVERLLVQWPSRSLQANTLIDTPGIDSLSTEVSDRTTTFLTPSDEPSAADAIVYLLRHLHSSDVRFLESFHDQAAGRATMVNTVGVLSRADEIGAGRLDALVSAQRVARRYSDDPMVRQLCQTVVPVVGLLAQTGRTLRQAEFEALRTLADYPRDVTESLLLSVDRFVRSDAPVTVDPEVREQLLSRFGVFGVRLSITMIRAGFRDATTLAADLVKRSGLDELRRLLAVQFTERRDLLKARTALLALDRVLREQPLPGTQVLADEVERILAGAHEFKELRLLTALRAPGVDLSPDAATEAERLLGGFGTAAEVRVGLERGASPTHIQQAATDALRRWRERAESPLTDRTTASACRVVTRSCEGVLAGVRH